MPVQGMTERQTLVHIPRAGISSAQLLLSAPRQLLQVDRAGGFGELTLKMVQIFPRESRSRGCWYLLFHNALLHGNLSVPLSANILAVVRESSRAFLVH